MSSSSLNAPSVGEESEENPISLLSSSQQRATPTNSASKISASSKGSKKRKLISPTTLDVWPTEAQSTRETKKHHRPRIESRPDSSSGRTKATPKLRRCQKTNVQSADKTSPYVSNDLSQFSQPVRNKAGAKPKLVSRANLKPCGRCDRCILQRRKCDGAHPVCGRCVLIGQSCEYHDPAITRTQLEEMQRKDRTGEVAALKRTELDEGRAEYELVKWPARPGREESIKTSQAQADHDIGGGLRVSGSWDEAKPVLQRPSQRLVRRNRAAAQRVAGEITSAVDSWTYGDHLDMLKAINEPRIENLTGEQVFGHAKGNASFEKTTKLLQDFDKLQDLDENMSPEQEYPGLKLDWEYETCGQFNLPNGALTTSNPVDGPWLTSRLRQTLGIPEYRVPGVEAPQFAGRSRARVQLQTYWETICSGEGCTRSLGLARKARQAG